MADSTAMTIEFLRARLLSERSVSKSARERADQLAKKVQELEDQLRVASVQRKQAEMATNKVLSILESRGFTDFAGAIDSYSNRENVLEEEGKCSNQNSGVIGNDDESSMPSRIDEAQEESESRGKSLSWKSHANSSETLDRKKEEQARQRQRMILLSRIGSSPQLSLGKSCRKFKKSLDEGTGRDDAEIEKTKIDEAADATLQSSDNHENSNGGDEAMERAIEQQDQLIDQFMAEENAQREWEENYKDPREPQSTAVAAIDDGETRSECPQEAEYVSEGADGSRQFSDVRKEEEEEREGEGEEDRKDEEKSASSFEEPGCDIAPPDHVGEIMTEQPDESKDDSRQEEIETVESRSDGGRASEEEWSLIRNPVNVADHPRETKGRGAGNVLDALQRARLTLRQELHRLEPRKEEIQPIGIPFGPRSLFRLPSDVNIEAESSRLMLYSHGGFGEGIAVSTCTETRTSMAATFSRNVGATTMYGGLSSSFSMGDSSGTSRFGRRFAR